MISVRPLQFSIGFVACVCDRPLCDGSWCGLSLVFTINVRSMTPHEWVSGVVCDSSLRCTNTVFDYDGFYSGRVATYAVRFYSERFWFIVHVSFCRYFSVFQNDFTLFQRFFIIHCIFCLRFVSIFRFFFLIVGAAYTQWVLCLLWQASTNILNEKHRFLARRCGGRTRSIF